MMHTFVKSTIGKCPNASLVILCFNQEQHVGAALKAALSQIGDPIEIIVSDDGSSDRTLEVAQEVADRYDGPHRVTVRRTPHNLGTLHHLFDVAAIAHGDLLIVGAADDLSLPGRTEALIAAWQHGHSKALFSAYQIIDEAGTVIEDHHRFDDHWLPIHDYLPGRELVSIHGASSAYDRETLLSLPRPSGRVLFEDTWLTLVLALSGHRITYVDKPLVAYRRHAGSITNFAGGGHTTRETIEAADASGRRSAAAYHDAIGSVRELAMASRHRDALAMDVIDHDLRFFAAQAKWPDLSWRSKMMIALDARQPWMRRWAWLRLFGPGMRVAIARIRQRQWA